MEFKIIWIGNRESEILYTNLFYKSITIYGSNSGNNVSYNKNDTGSIANFFIETINTELQQNDIRLYFYSNKFYEKVISKAPYLKKYVICNNSSDFISFIDNKTYAQLWASNIMPVIEFTEMFGNECTYDNISKIFPEYDKYIIQNNQSSGGIGTFLLTKNNEPEIMSSIENHMCYRVSPYYDHSYSINTHIIISDECVSLLAPSIQIIENVNNRLLYKGADFIAYKKTSTKTKEKTLEYAKKIAEALKRMGYLGICGLDLLIHNNNIYFLEINPRFQASSILINKALNEHNLPSLQTIVYNIFIRKKQLSVLSEIEKLEIPYSTLSFYQNENSELNSHLIKALKNKTDNIDIIIEENTNTVQLDEYMFRVIFNTNISSVNYDGELFIYQNLLNYSKINVDIYRKNEKLLKCALLTQGIIINPDVISLYKDNNAIKKATFDAIDITIGNKYIVNCPTKTKFVELTPFSLRKTDHGIDLYYFDNFVETIDISLQEQLPKTHTKNKIYIHRIGYLTTDRLRIKHASICNFKKKNQGCKFCHITSRYLDDFSLNDIYETIDCYSSNVNFRHYLIGGPSNTYEMEENYIENIAKYIRTKTKKPIYIMCVPPKNIKILEIYHNIGVTEVAFNIEIFNRSIAEQLMPGKGKIGIKQYENALKESSKLFGKENTRSMLIIGLDSRSSLLKGVEYLCSIGVTPMISPFRPMDNTELVDFVPPTIEYIYEIYLKAKQICENYNINLGPKCRYCQNNTLV